MNLRAIGMRVFVPFVAKQVTEPCPRNVGAMARRLLAEYGNALGGSGKAWREDNNFKLDLPRLLGVLRGGQRGLLIHLSQGEVALNRAETRALINDLKSAAKRLTVKEAGLLAGEIFARNHRPGDPDLFDFANAMKSGLKRAGVFDDSDLKERDFYIGMSRGLQNVDKNGVASYLALVYGKYFASSTARDRDSSLDLMTWIIATAARAKGYGMLALAGYATELNQAMWGDPPGVLFTAKLARASGYDLQTTQAFGMRMGQVPPQGLTEEPLLRFVSAVTERWLEASRVKSPEDILRAFDW